MALKREPKSVKLVPLKIFETGWTVKTESDAERKLVVSLFAPAKCDFKILWGDEEHVLSCQKVYHLSRQRCTI